MTGPVYDWLTGDPPASLDAAAVEFGLDVKDRIFLFLLMKHGDLRRMVMDACEAVADDINLFE